MSLVRSKHGGFSLVELMVGLATSLFLLAGVMGIFSLTLSSQGSTLKTTRLNQELRSVMDLMSRDIRRAGYWQLAYATGHPAGNLTLSGTSGTITVTSSGTPFSTLDNGVVGRTLMSGYGAATIDGYTNGSEVTATVTRNFTSTQINEGDWMISNLFSETANNITIAGSGSCIQYTYDRNGDATVDANEIFAFRLHNGVIQMYPGSGTAPNCTSGTGTWEDLTSDSINVSALQFSETGSQCLNLSSGAADCNATTPSSRDVLLYIRQINVSLTGTLVADSHVSRTLTKSMRLRNDRMVVY